MYQNYNYYPATQPAYPQQRQQMSAPIMPGLKGHPVTSLEEAKAASIDFDGSITFFPDLAHKKIYTKQINMDGTATLNVYSYEEPVEQAIQPIPQYITREELDSAIADLKALINGQTASKF